MENYLHDRENSDDTERHLSENRDKLETDCDYLLRLMMRGRRLSSQDVHDMKIHDRRLRNLYSAGKCKRQWKLNDKGKRLFVEYFVEREMEPTKRDAIAWATEFLQKQQQGIPQQLFD